MNRLFNIFCRIVAYPYVFFRFRLKKYYISKKAKKQKIKGNTIVLMNHFCGEDPQIAYTTFLTKRVSIFASEHVFRKGRTKFFKWLVTKLGAIMVDRKNIANLSWYKKALKRLKKDNNILIIFPEGGTNRKRGDLLPFKQSFVRIALDTSADILPVFCNGKLGFEDRTRVMIGEIINIKDLYIDELDFKTNANIIANIMRNKVIELGDTLYRDYLKKKLAN